MNKNNTQKKMRNVIVRGVPMTLIALLPFANSCKKENLTQQGPERYIATKEATIDFNFNDKWNVINDDTVAYYAQDRDIKWLYLNYIDTTNATSTFTGEQFFQKMKGLYPYFSSYDKIIGKGTIVVNDEISDSDCDFFTEWGYKIQRVNANSK